MILKAVFRITSTFDITTAGDGKEGEWSNSIKVITQVHVITEYYKNKHFSILQSIFMLHF